MSRNRLAPHLAWPVSPSRLRAILGDEHDGLRFYFHDDIKRPSDKPVNVGWTTQESVNQVGLDYWTSGIKVGVEPVAKAELDVIRSLVEAEVLPDLVRWISEARSAGEGWQLTAHSRTWKVTPAGVVAKDRSGTR